jgi:hypothetical protein
LFELRKRLKSRPTVIDLNGHQPDAALFYLSIMAPLMLIVICAAQHGVWTNPTSVLPILVGMIGIGGLYGEILRLQHNNITFTRSGIKLPGVGKRFVDFSEINYINLQERKDTMCIGTRKGAVHIVKLKGLSRESAKQLWQLIATRMKQAQVKPEVKDVLLNWVAAESTTDARMHASLLNWTIAEQALQARENVTIIPVDPKLDIDLKQNTIASRLGVYINFYITTCLQVWVAICALLTALIMVGAVGSMYSLPLLQSLGSLGNAANSNLLALLFAPADVLKELLFYMLQELTPIFGNALGAFGYCSMLVWLLVYVGRNWAEPDYLEITRYGVTTLKKYPSGSVPQAHLNWQDIKSIELAGSFGSAGKLTLSNKLGKSIKFVNREGKSINLPLRLLAASSVRRQLLEAFDVYSRDIEIDPAVLQAVAPRAEAEEQNVTFTELWLDSLNSAPKLNELTPLQAGTSLACGITIKSQLASGGQGVTYLADDLEGNPVVLKETILPVFVEGARDGALTKFEQSAKLLAGLNHPQIVKLHNHFVEEHRAFLVMEFVPGSTLKDKVEEAGPMSQEAVLAIAGQLIDILQYLHDLEPAVVHRDFTPDNLIIDGEGRIKLVDFGVAIEGGQQSRSNIVGKQNYLPPEQVAGKACPQSDIYAMGATLYYLLTGLEPEPLSQSNPKDINASVGEALNELVQSATALDLSQRLADAQTARDILANHSSESVVIKMPEQEKAGVKVRRKKEQI